MGWGYGHPMWGFGPFFPIMAIIFMVVMAIIVFRFFGGKSGMCGFGRRDELDELRREVKELKGEIEALKRGR